MKMIAVIVNKIDSSVFAIQTELKYLLAPSMSCLYIRIVMKRPAMEPIAVVSIDEYPMMLLTSGINP